MKKIIMISGKARHGKDSIAKILTDKLIKDNYKCCTVALADYLKYMLYKYKNWNGEKNENGRMLLQTIGTDLIRNKLGWETFHAERLAQDIKIFENDYDYFIIPDARFINEIAYMTAKFPYNIITIRVNRLNFTSPLTKEQQSHPSETDLDNYKGFDYIINCENGLDKLEKEVKKIYEELIGDDNLNDIPIPSKVKVIKINNTIKAEHLKPYIGRKGITKYNPIIKHNIKRWKVIFDEKTRESAYFRRSELEVI